MFRQKHWKGSHQKERERAQTVLISIKIKHKLFKIDLQICQIAELDKADGVLVSC